VSEVDDFLADVLPRLREAEIALHNGDPGPRRALRSPSSVPGGTVVL
jgi:hypothetical protein